MCVPGDMAATSAAIVMRNPAEAARLPDGVTKTATGTADVRRRDGMDDAVDFRGVDERCGALSGSLTHGAERGRGADGERREQEAQDETRSRNAHKHPLTVSPSKKLVHRGAR